MTEAEITPNTLWQDASKGKVIVEGKTYENIPILRILWTPAQITISKDQYPDGVVILNENPVPNNESSITLPMKSAAQDSINVDVGKNAGWPNGSVVIFD